MTRIGDWLATVTAVGAVLGCMIAALIWVGTRMAKTIASLKVTRADQAAFTAPRSVRIRLLPLLDSAGAFVIAALLAGDDLFIRAATSLPVGTVGWVELVAAAALCCGGMWLLVQVVSALRQRPSAPYCAAGNWVRVAGIGGRSR